MQDFEKLGVFYLGRRIDLEHGTPPAPDAEKDELLLYDSSDLVTHAVCVGMTGSGKTGLCIGLLEEAAIDGIPAIVIDPKGDLANLLLAFPSLSADEFRPWIDEDEARRAERTPDEHARAQAELWKQGLARWGQDGARVARLAASAEFAVYTPGSTAGLPVSIVSSLAAPPEVLRDDAELFNERVATTVSSLLGLLSIDADPLQSREHILLANVLARTWREGRDLDLAALIEAIQKPPMQKVGVLDLEAFYPAKERFQLAMRLNNLLASPSFASWLEGEPLDVGRALHGPSGRPRVAIYSIAHLSDPERMFFVSLLLEATLAWMRQQSGTSSLRALLYMDEIFGYFPPVANPPSKAPLLTLLKQARAYGLGVVLATQNPVDLDYKGLANCGTWFIGRLQTERDKLRVLDGLEGAAAQAGASRGGAFDRARMDRTLSALGKRVFLMNDVHETAPVVFETRWTLSYLRGPLTRTQIKRLMDPVKAASAKDEPREAAAPSKVAASEARAPIVPPTPAKTVDRVAASSTSSARPVLPPGVTEVFLPPNVPAKERTSLLYRPCLVACGRVYYRDAKLAIDMATTPSLLVELGTGPVAVDWDGAVEVAIDERELEPEPRAGAAFADVPPEASKPKSFDAWKRSTIDRLYRTQKLELLRSPSLELVSRPGEDERAFRIRLRESAREERDRLAEKLRAKYAPKLAALEERVRAAQQRVQKEQEQARDSKVSSLLSFGVTLLGAFAGRKTISAANASRAATTARSVGRASKESKDVDRATETVEALRERLAELDREFKAELDLSARDLDPEGELEHVAIDPKKSNVTVRLLALAWVPFARAEDGSATPAWSPSGAPAR